MNLIINHSSMEPIYEQLSRQFRALISTGQMKEGQPIYEQIVEQIKKQILQGTLREGAPLDSVRMLAKDLKVSALTVKKAYDALEEEQLIATVHGKGSFVLGVNPSLLAEEQKREIEQRMEQLVAKARAYGMSDEELRAVLELFLEA